MGLYGGTFDPIHYGHLRIAEEVREMYGLDEVHFIPAKIPPHKQDKIVSASEIRVAMISASIESNPNFRVSLIEILKPDISYTYDTLQDYFRRYRDEGSAVYFIMGMDSFKDLPTWERYAEFFNLAGIIVCSRPGHTYHSPNEVLPEDVLKKFWKVNDMVYEHNDTKNSIMMHPSETFNLSSSDIRTRVRRGHSIKYLVPEVVRKLIKDAKLYRRLDSWEEEL